MGKAIYSLRSLPLHRVILRCNMFTILKAVLTFSFLISIVNSIPRPSAEDLNPNLDDALHTNIFLDGMSNNDDLTTSTPLTSMFDSDLTVDTNLIGNQENLFAMDTSTGSSCRAEDSQSIPAIGRLRRREESSSGSGGGDQLCVSPTKETSDPNLDNSLLQLPIVNDVAAPDISGRPDICPAWKFGERVIALCSADTPSIMTNIDLLRIRVVTNAMICMYRLTPGRGLAIHNWVWGGLAYMMSDFDLPIFLVGFVAHGLISEWIWYIGNPFYGCVLLERLYCCRSVGSVVGFLLSLSQDYSAHNLHRCKKC